MITNTAFDQTGAIIGTRDENGVWDQTPYGEYVDAFIAETGMTDWADREAEAAAWEVNPPVDTETDSWGHGLPSVADWDWFAEVSYVDPAERA